MMYEVMDVPGTADTPRVLLNPETGEYEISGVSFPEDVRVFYGPVLYWLSEYAQNPKPEMTVHFKMNYFNTASSKMLLELMLAIAKVKEAGANVEIVWHYEAGDDDMEDSGRDYEDITNLPFRFQPGEDEEDDEPRF